MSALRECSTLFTFLKIFACVFLVISVGCGLFYYMVCDNILGISVDKYAKVVFFLTAEQPYACLGFFLEVSYSQNLYIMFICWFLVSWVFCLVDTWLVLRIYVKCHYVCSHGFVYINMEVFHRLMLVHGERVVCLVYLGHHDWDLYLVEHYPCRPPNRPPVGTIRNRTHAKSSEKEVIDLFVSMQTLFCYYFSYIWLVFACYVDMCIVTPKEWGLKIPIWKGTCTCSFIFRYFNGQKMAT